MEELSLPEASVNQFYVTVGRTDFEAVNVTKTSTDTETYSPGTHTKTTTHVIKVVLPEDNAEELADQLEAERQQLNEKYDKHDNPFSFDIRVAHEKVYRDRNLLSQLCTSVSGRDDTLTFTS